MKEDLDEYILDCIRRSAKKYLKKKNSVKNKEVERPAD
jgi:hypothetical protein